MQLQIVSPERSIFEGEVSYIRLPGSEGSFEVLDGHAPLIASLDAGTVTVRQTGGAQQTFSINAGFLEVSGNKATILV